MMTPSIAKLTLALISIAVSADAVRHNVTGLGLDFFMIGDWGHDVNASLAVDHVDFEEEIVANQAGVVGAVIKPKFYLALGDNFYEVGVGNTTDPLWAAYYSNVWTHPSTQVPWYPVLGNHDYYVGGSPQAQIDYYYENKDNRWIMPDYQYTKKWTIPGSKKTLEIVFINTPQLCPEISQTKILWPTSATSIKIYYQQAQQWIKNALRRSTADFLMVAGHYHMYTNTGANGGNSSAEYKCMFNRIEPYFQQYGVMAYFHGHQHTFEHFYMDNIHHITVGHSADKEDPLLPGTPTGLLYNATIAGFGWMRVTGRDATIYFIDKYGNYIYNYTMTNPAARAAAQANAIANPGY